MATEGEIKKALQSSLLMTLKGNNYENSEGM